jgi:hypothetical protein
MLCENPSTKITWSPIYQGNLEGLFTINLEGNKDMCNYNEDCSKQATLQCNKVL